MQEGFINKIIKFYLDEALSDNDKIEALSLYLDSPFIWKYKNFNFIQNEYDRYSEWLLYDYKLYREEINEKRKDLLYLK